MPLPDRIQHVIHAHPIGEIANPQGPSGHEPNHMVRPQRCESLCDAFPARHRDHGGAQRLRDLDRSGSDSPGRTENENALPGTDSRTPGHREVHRLEVRRQRGGSPKSSARGLAATISGATATNSP